MSGLTRRSVLRSAFAVSAGSLVSRSMLAHANALLLNQPMAEAAIAPRVKLLFDFGWRFSLGSVSDPLRDMGFGKTPGTYEEGFSKTGGFSFATEKFDDSKWRVLNLPHDWAVELPFVDDPGLESHGFKPLGRKYPDTSIGWYRRSFDIPASDLGRRISLEFDGAFRDAIVFVNGAYVGRNDNGYVPFHFDISDFLNYGGKNVVMVRMDATFGDGWFYEGAGIYRHVWLTKTDPLHLGRWESYVRCAVKGNDCTLTLGTIAVNQGKQIENSRVRWQILNAEGKVVGTADSAGQAIHPGESVHFETSAPLRTPALWSPETPYLYSAVATLESSGTARDAERISFGVRTVEFDADKGFFLNGKPVKIKGTCNHQDHAGVGAALPDALQWYRLSVLKEMGGNAVRTSHNMPTPEWVDACDRMGMMMMCETRAMSSSEDGMAQLETMIKRFRNSPSIILWSMGNEEFIIEGEPAGEHIAATMVERSHELDPTRLCTAAVDREFGKGVSLALDVEGLNYNLSIIDEYHRTHPKQPLIGSETGSTVATRGIYTTDTLRNWVSAYDKNHPAWAALAEEWWSFYGTREYLSGGFAWTGFDYRGEPTPYSWPSISSQFGIVDMCGFPKDNFYYYKAWWGQEPVLHLFPHWNWEERTGEPISVWVYSNLDEVELFLNGRSQGSQKVHPLSHLEWNVKYEPGVIEARGKKAGAIVLTDKRETTGEPVSIRLTADRNEINADAEDIALLRVETLDAMGRHVPTTNTLIHFKITGDGEFMGVGNGDPNCQQSDKEPQRNLFNGLAQVIVQSTHNAGAIKVEAYAEDSAKLTPGQLTIRTREVSSDHRPCVL